MFTDLQSMFQSFQNCRPTYFIFIFFNFLIQLWYVLIYTMTQYTTTSVRHTQSTWEAPSSTAHILLILLSINNHHSKVFPRSEHFLIQWPLFLYSPVENSFDFVAIGLALTNWHGPKKEKKKKKKKKKKKNKSKLSKLKYWFSLKSEHVWNQWWWNNEYNQ